MWTWWWFPQAVSEVFPLRAFNFCAHGIQWSSSRSIAGWGWKLGYYATTTPPDIKFDGVLWYCVLSKRSGVIRCPVYFPLRQQLFQDGKKNKSETDYCSNIATRNRKCRSKRMDLGFSKVGPFVCMYLCRLVLFCLIWTNSRAWSIKESCELLCAKFAIGSHLVWFIKCVVGVSIKLLVS